MASTLELNLNVSGKDTLNVSANSNLYGYGDLVASLPITDGVAVRMVLPTSASGVNIFPRFADPDANVFFILFFHYAVEADRALGVELEIDTGNIVVCSDTFAGSATTTLGISSNANNDVIITGVAYQI